MSDDIFVKEIVSEYLRKHGYAGLRSPDDCTCSVDDLAPPPCYDVQAYCCACSLVTENENE